MKQRLDGRFLGGGFHTTCEKLGVHLFVAKIFPVECLQERSESAFCHILVGKSCQIAPAGLDDKRIVRKLGRHIAFPRIANPRSSAPKSWERVKSVCLAFARSVILPRK